MGHQPDRDAQGFACWVLTAAFVGDGSETYNTKLRTPYNTKWQDIDNRG